MTNPYCREKKGELMCIICLEYQKHRDIADARVMLLRARGEPNNIDKSHLKEIEVQLDSDEKAAKNAASSNP
jgi:hypothetical protein